MSQKINFGSDVDYNSVLRYKGVFDIQATLKFLKKWMEQRDYSFYERKYKKKPDLKGIKYDITIESDKRINPYVKWYLKIRILAHDIERIEVVENGKKVTKDFGRIKFDFDGTVETDPDSRWERTPFFVKLRKFFHNHVVKWEEDMIWIDELYYNMYQMKEDLSRYLGMYYIG